jgi:hypothetical protein
VSLLNAYPTLGIVQIFKWDFIDMKKLNVTQLWFKKYFLHKILVHGDYENLFFFFTVGSDKHSPQAALTS